ncbi:CapA family protein [Bdellovibrio sp. ZAP7]|uniref:CapA family protein n=1 Tax=Bdellovibrio sp. ZAP7 TaxID=2231053 RepID=UPI00115A0D69|nr:CapA family protein [Bdellovibrio sp. ZAP7]QDK46733.1 CapA family protein [Bdellovibrio sp. ZAP7]
MKKLIKKSLAVMLGFFPSVSLAMGTDLEFSGRCGSSQYFASLSFVGDVLIHKLLYVSVVQESKDFSQIWRGINPLFSKANFSIANLEGPAAMGIDTEGRDWGDVGFIYDDRIYSGTNMRFNYHPRILSDLKKSGLDLLTMANNHILDRGSIGIDKSVIAARAAGIHTVGIRHSQERNAPYSRVVTVQGINIAFVGCTEMTNGRPDSKSQVLNCFNSNMIASIKELSARSDVDAVVIYPHWGDEYKQTPNARQVSAARSWLDAGATVVVGSHPHVLQPWDKYVTKDGRETFIVYSLGNFVAAQKDVERKASAVMYVGLTKPAQGKAVITGVAYTPTVRNGTKIYPVGASGDKAVLKYLSHHYGTSGILNPEESLPLKLCRSLH